MFPLLSKHLTASVDSILWEPVLAHEALLCNLLEVALFHQHVCAALSEDAALELCDFCWRKLAHLSISKAPAAQGVRCFLHCRRVRPPDLLMIAIGAIPSSPQPPIRRAMMTYGMQRVWF